MVFGQNFVSWFCLTFAARLLAAAYGDNGRFCSPGRVIFATMAVPGDFDNYSLVSGDNLGTLRYC
jgi:hypothetical protein